MPPPGARLGAGREGNGVDRLELLAESGTVGAGGAGFPTHVKLGVQVSALIANAAECEPLLYANQELMRHEAAQVIQGLRAAGELVGATRLVLALKAKHKASIAAARQALTASSGPPVEIATLPDYYPVGDEQALVAEVTGRVVPEAGLPLEVGAVVCNVETLANVAAALERRAVTHKWVTVTGAVSRPVTLKVPVGASVEALVAAAGGATLKQWAAIDGGPLMGRPVLDPHTPVTKTTSGLILLPREHPAITRPALGFALEARRARSACVRCTLCTELCPRYLQGHDLRPHQVMQSLALSPLAEPVYDQAWLCCECGICEVFSCPMGLSPRRVMGDLKRQFGAAGRRYPRRDKEYQPRRDSAYRRIPARRLLQRMGLLQYDLPAPYSGRELAVPAVTLLLRQHIGAPAVPVVQAGDLVTAGQTVARVEPGKLGAAVHASISGVVTQVTAQWIRVEEVSADG